MTQVDVQTAVDVTSDLEDAIGEKVGDDTVQQFKKKSVSGAAAYMIRTLFLQLLNMAALAILAFYLNEKDVGIYGVAVQFIGLLTFFSDVGLGSALIQKKSDPTNNEYRSVFTVQQLLSLGIFAITIVVWWLGTFKAQLGDAGGWVLLALGISFPLVTLKTIPSVMLERKLDFHKLTIPNIAEQIVYNVILIALAINGFGVIAYAYAIMARTLIGIIIMQFLQPWSFGFSFDMKALKELLGGGVKFQLNDVIARVKDQLFYLYLAKFLSIEQFSYISLAKQYSQLPYQLTVQNVIAITFPAYARLQHSPQLLKRAIEKTLFFISLAIFPLLVGMAIFITPVIALIPGYHKWQPAILTFVLFTISIGWGALSTPLTNTLNAIGKINTTLKLMVFWTVLTWVLTPIALKVWGFNGVAWATFAISFTSVLPMWAVKEVVPVDIWDQVWRQLSAAAIMALVGVVGLSWWSQSWLHLIIGMGVTVAAYGISILLIGRDKVFIELKSLRK
jgi:PST family polysaccharide transporter